MAHGVAAVLGVVEDVAHQLVPFHTVAGQLLVVTVALELVGAVEALQHCLTAGFQQGVVEKLRQQLADRVAAIGGGLWGSLFQDLAL